VLLVRHRVDLHERQERSHQPVGVDGNQERSSRNGLWSTENRIFP
jgi:hypothetical protein